MNFNLSNTLADWLTERTIPFKYLPGPPPCLWVSVNDWASVANLAKQEGLRLVAEWASQQNESFFIHSSYALPKQGYALVFARLDSGNESFPSLAPHYIAAVRMERAIHDLYQIVPEGHPDLRPWIKGESWPEQASPLRKDFSLKTIWAKQTGSYPFTGMKESVGHEIPVGPIHAGIIEPGHFRFCAVGETILTLEERLGYVHKGIEKHMESRDVDSAARLAGKISGDATVAHTWAFCMAAEQASETKVPLRADYIRAILCERERMANHIGDIGAMCNDVAWSFMQMQCQRLREDLARLHGNLFGHRLLMDCLVPGGVACDLDDEKKKLIREQTHAIGKEMSELFQIYEDHISTRERVIGSGSLATRDAQDLGVVGFIGRSCEQNLDARCDAAYSPYDRHLPHIKVCRGGDVSARLWIRFEEIQVSVGLITTLLEELPSGQILENLRTPADGRWGFAAVESWRGEIVTWLRFGPEGQINRCYVRDPSMVNWLGLELVVRDIPVPDFPLNNKSFNCSYSGHDL